MAVSSQRSTWWQGCSYAVCCFALSCGQGVAPEGWSGAVASGGQGGQAGQGPQAALGGHAGASIGAEDSSAWSWQECGSVPAPPTPNDPVVRQVLAVTVSPDGKYLVSANGADAYLWQIAEPFADSVMVRPLSTGMELSAEFSADSKQVAISGDGVAVFEVSSGAPLYHPAPREGPVRDCFDGFLNFSHSQKWLAGSRFSDFVDVVADADFSLVAELPTPNCNTAAGFSADDSLLATSTKELYRTSDWSRIWPKDLPPDVVLDPTSEPIFDSVVFDPGGKEVLISNCRSGPNHVVCDNTEYDLETARVRSMLPVDLPHPGYSPDGSWIVSGGSVLQRPSYRVIHLAPYRLAGAFTPNSDIITGGPEGTLERWCRQL